MQLWFQMSTASDSRTIQSFTIQRIRASQSERAVDSVVVEEPLSIRLEYWFKDSPQSENLALTMRTPGNDRELAAGFLLSEGVIRKPPDLVSLRKLGTEPSNEIIAELSREVDVDAWRLGRQTILHASCGVCGKHNLEAMLESLPPQSQNSLLISAGAIEELPQILSQTQVSFAQTGGLHAAALVSVQGELITIFEDIGRHNALDKLIGHSFLNGDLPLTNQILFLSSRSSFELVQKTAMAGAPLLATIGSPSSLAIETARRLGLTLIGFVRDNRFNVYSGEWRIKLKN